MKLTFEQKIQIAKEALEDSSNRVASKWKIHPWTVYKIKALYLENPMLLKHGKNKKYSFEFKEKIINDSTFAFGFYLQNACNNAV